MEIKDMNLEQIEERLAAIATEIEEEGADLDAIEEETRNLKARKKELEEEAEKNQQKRAAALNQGTVVKKEERKMPVEQRTQEYMNLFADYIKSGDYSECRAFAEAHEEELEVRMVKTENVSGGTVAVPTVIFDTIKHAWETDGIMRRVKKSYLQGNIKIGFEVSSTPAAIHAEGTEAPSEEELTLGIITMVPDSIKKWITITDEVMDMGGEAFLRYIYEELAYRLARKAVEVLIGKINAAPPMSQEDAAAVPYIVREEITPNIIAEAIARLSDEAVDPVIIMNKSTWAEFKRVQYDLGFAIDPFEGLEVEFSNVLPSIGDQSSTAPYLIVGDLFNGALANFPNGEDIKYKFDDLSLAEEDLVKVVGRMYVAIDVVAPNHFVKVYYSRG